MASEPDAGPRDPRVALGRAAESAAAAFLASLGYSVLARNVRLCGAELDLVCREGGVIVFVEVRSRSDRRHGGPLETIRATKIARISRAAAAYLARRGLSQAPARFDVVGVDWRGERAVCTLIRSAFESPSGSWT